MKRLRRNKNFQLSLAVTNDNFLRPPKESQRNWLVNRFVRECEQNLAALHDLASDFVPGSNQVQQTERLQAELTDHEIMEDWQIPIMEAMASLMPGGKLLEVGFGRGVSADYLQRTKRPTSHTIVECNDSIVGRFEEWRKGFPDADIRLLHGRWEEMTGQMESYDSIFFHTYALDYEDFVERAVEATTFADNFFSLAAQMLNPGGVFTYLSNEIDSLSREHQRLLLKSFSGFKVSKVELDLPPDVDDAWWANSMVVVGAYH